MNEIIIKDTPEQRVRKELMPIATLVDFIKTGEDIPEANLQSLIALSEQAIVRLIASSTEWK